MAGHARSQQPASHPQKLGVTWRKDGLASNEIAHFTGNIHSLIGEPEVPYFYTFSSKGMVT